MSLISELKRRNVFRVAAGYVVLSWLLLQVADLLMELFGLPGTWGKAVLGLLVIGFLPAIIVSWVYEMTPEGLKRETEVVREASITAHTGQKLNVAIVVLLAVAIVVFAVDRFVIAPAVPVAASPTATSAARPADGIPVVAVLPLTAFSKDEEGQFLASGLHDDLLTRLARLKAFRVISRTSVMEYADTTKNVRDIGAELGAGYILEGGLQALGGNVRINAQLIDAATDEHLWAETFDRALTTENLFDVQGDIAAAIAEAMHATLSPQETEQFDDVPTRDLDAYQSYLRGTSEQDLLTQSSMRAAVDAFRDATDRDPEFTEAWSELAIALVRRYWEEGAEDGAAPDTALRDSAEDALERTRALRPDGLATQLADAYVQYYGYRNYSNALISLGRAESIAPNDARVISLRGYLLRRLGRFSESADALLQALELNPNNPGLHREALATLAETDRCGEAADLRTRALDRIDNDAGILTAAAWLWILCDQDTKTARDHILRGKVNSMEQLESANWVLIYADDYPAAIDMLTRARDQWIKRPEDRLKAESLLAWLYRETGQDALANASSDTARDLSASVVNPGSTTLGDMALATATWGDPEETLVYGQRTLESAPEDAFLYQNFVLQVMRAYAVAGLTDEALDVLEDTLTRHHLAHPPALVLDPMLDPVTATDRFRELVRTASARQLAGG